MSASSREAYRSPRGFIGLVVVILMGALVLAVGLASAYIGQTQLIIAAQIDRASSARQAVAACVDETLLRLKKDPAYAGGTIPVGSLTCTVTVSGSGASRTIVASAADGDINQSVTVIAGQKTNGGGNASAWGIVSWTEANP